MSFGDIFESKETRQDIHHIAECLCELVRLVRKFFLPHSLLLLQEEGGQMGVIKGVPSGGQGSFATSLLPVGSALPAGQALATTYSADDPAVVLTPSADGSSVVAAVPASDTQGSAPAGSPPGFNLKVSGTAPALSAPITGTAFVPILPPAPNLPTALDLNQTA